jgi:transcriptional regulator with XRE-family HTH domain
MYSKQGGDPMSKERNAKLNDRLKEALEAAGMRPIELSEKTGIPKSMLSYYINGRTEPKADRLYIIAQALDVSEAWLLGFDVPKQRSVEQKKNDELAKLVVKMRTDVDFYNTVAALAKLSEKQYRGVQQLIAAFDE